GLDQAQDQHRDGASGGEPEGDDRGHGGDGRREDARGGERGQRGRPGSDPPDEVGGTGDGETEGQQDRGPVRLRRVQRGEDRQQRRPARQDQHRGGGAREAQRQRGEGEQKQGGEERLQQRPAEGDADPD